MAKEKIDDEFLTAHAQQIFDNSKNWVDQKIRPQWEKDNDQYNGVFSKNEREKSNTLLGQGRLFIPKTYSHIQRMHVDILETFFFDQEEVVSVGSWKSIPFETREIVKSLLNYRLNSHPIDFYQELFESTLDSLKNKIGILKVFPELKTEKKNGKEVITQYAPCIEAVPYEDVFFHPEATWKNYWKHPIVHRMKRNRDYLERHNFKNMDKVQAGGVARDTDLIKLQRQEIVGTPFTNNTSPFAQDDLVKEQEEIFVYEVWTFLDLDNTGELESVFYSMVGDSGGPTFLGLDVEKNELPYNDMAVNQPTNRAPFVAMTALPEPHQMYGKSWPEILSGLQRETNAIRNQRREAVALAMRQPLLASRHANLDLVSLVNRRIGSVVLGDDISPNAVRELDLKDPTNASVQEQLRTDSDFFETTSIPPNLLGAPAPREETATAVTSQNVNANKKIAQIIKNLANTGVIPSLNMLLRLEQTYETDEFIQLVTGRQLGWRIADDGIPPRQIIEGDFDLTVNVGINKQVQVNKWMLLMDRATVANQATAQALQMGVMAPEQASFLDVMKIFEKVFPLVGEKNIEEFKLQAQAPPPQQGAGQGLAPQTALPSEGTTAFGVNNPEALSGLPLA